MCVHLQLNQARKHSSLDIGGIANALSNMEKDAEEADNLSSSIRGGAPKNVAAKIVASERDKLLGRSKTSSNVVGAVQRLHQVGQQVREGRKILRGPFRLNPRGEIKQVKRAKGGKAAPCHGTAKPSEASIAHIKVWCSFPSIFIVSLLSLSLSILFYLSHSLSLTHTLSLSRSHLYRNFGASRRHRPGVAASKSLPRTSARSRKSTC